MSKFFIKFLKDEKGATAFEYTLIACLIGVTIFSSLSSLGNKLSNGFTNIANKLK